MIKSILICIIALSCSINTLAQNTKHQFKIEFEEFDSTNLTESQQTILDLLVRREIKKLKKDIEQLQVDYKYGKISKTEFDFQKTKKSEDIAYKISKCVDIITESEQYSVTDSSTSMKITESKKASLWEVMKDNKGPKSFYLNINSKNDTVAPYYPRNLQGLNFGFGFANWLDEDMNKYNDPKSKLYSSSSLYFQFTFKNFHFLNPKTKIASIDYGLTLMSKYYQFNNPNYSLNAKDNGIISIEDVNITESKLIQTSLEVPLEFTYRFGKSKGRGLVITGGIFGGMNLRTKQKIKYTVNNNEFKAKIISDFDTQRFYAGGKFKIGIRKIALEGRYNFTEQFNHDSDINVNPYTIGLTIGL